jgi:hypothetical protein
MDREDTKSRSAPAGGSGGGTQDRWTEEDFKQRVRERLDSIEQHLDRIDQRLYRIEGHGEGRSGGRGGRGEGRGEGGSEGRGRRRRGG